MAVTDETLLAEARAGDSRAFSELLRRNDRAQRALAHRMVGSVSLMDDVLQESYVKAWRAIGAFRGDSGFGTWLYRITYRTCLDVLRSGRDAQVIDDQVPSTSRSGNPESAGDRIDVRRALLRLPEDQRAVVVLVDAEGHRYEDVAQILGIAEGTVASRLHRARRTLRTALAEEEGRDR